LQNEDFEMTVNDCEADGRRSSGSGDAQQRRPLSGRAVLIWLVAFFGVVIGVNALMAKLAIDTMPGTDVDSAYQAGNAYNGQISAARDQEERRWLVQGHIERRADGRTVIDVNARDRNGQPLKDLTFSAQLERPIDRRADRRLALTEREAGIYRSEAIDVASGQWDLVLEADSGSRRVFLSRNRVLLK
jgi:nitrogen fixation protein FixH